MDSFIFTWAPAGILFLPLLAFAVLLFFGKRFPRGADLLGIGAMGLCFMLSIVLFRYNVLRGGTDGQGWSSAQAHPIVSSFVWMKVGGVQLTLGFLVDNLSSFMCLVVTGLATLVLIYSIFYMHGDAMYRRYFGFMCFFCFAMLGVVLSSNLLMTFVFWELVGLGSYFLIGFWFNKPPVAQDHHYQELKARYATGIDERYLSPAHAQKKAFVMNRVGDFGFAIGIMIFTAVMLQAAAASPAFASYTNGPLEFTNLYAATHAGAFDLPGVQIWGLSGTTLLTLAGILTFMGAMGKSAQFPLHTWLPDAMQGPTTGSSIIHAATMVAAGVYMVARIHPLLTDGSLFFVAMIGGVTAFLAASMALVQWDLKAVLAYSTISQLGYMMLGLGSGAYTAGVAHLFTHAIFKCMLFLCAGSVIHACHHLQDMNRMGGLRKRMPLTFLATLAGVLAISGVPLFSGFFSKDAILAGAFARALEMQDHSVLHWVPYVLGQVTAAMTAFYMCRLLFWSFFGEPRDQKVYSHVHESPAVATIPLMILAIGCLGFWWSGSLAGTNLHSLSVKAVELNEHGDPEEKRKGWIDAMMVSPVAEQEHAELAAHGAEALHQEEAHHKTAHAWATGLSLAGLVLGAGLAWLMYGAKTVKPDELLVKNPNTLGMLYELTSQLWFFDRLYQDGIVPAVKFMNRGFYFFDFQVLDQILVDGWAYFARVLSHVGRTFDDWVVDKFVDACGLFTGLAGQLTRSIQAGKIQYYVCVTFGALAVLLLLLVMM